MKLLNQQQKLHTDEQNQQQIKFSKMIAQLESANKQHQDELHEYQYENLSF